MAEISRKYRTRKYKLHYDEDQGDFLRPPHILLTPAVVTLNVFYALHHSVVYIFLSFGIIDSIVEF